ncbi:MAG: hypothetical protein M1837_001525 [Sclerophora amabilis]|nr:MAG: hypothetical protein M1837_001525 [Sclerophora amabilis]
MENPRYPSTTARRRISLQYEEGHGPRKSGCCCGAARSPERRRPSKGPKSPCKLRVAHRSPHERTKLRIPPSSVDGEHYSSRSAISDAEAASSVQRHFLARHLHPDQRKAEQDLIRLILTSPFHEAHLHHVLHLADQLFFENTLRHRVHLEWSHSSQPSFRTDVVGTTDLRPDGNGSFQTRITLSKPLLQSTAYDQRLVLSALLHEAIHSYLFIRRGFAAKIDGGHTPGFMMISKLINDWVGDQEYLQLYNVEADLANFRTKRADQGWDRCKSAWGQDNGFRSTEAYSTPRSRQR